MYNLVRDACGKKKAAAATVCLCLAGASPAFALPAFTFDPTAVGLNGPTFTADNMVLSDFMTVTLTPNGSGGANFTENGVLPISAFQLGSAPVTNNLNTGFGLYFQVSATGTQNTPVLAGNTVGTFSTLDYGLYGYDVTGPVGYKPSNATPTGVTNPLLLATGSLVSGGVGATTIPGIATIPNANTLLTFVTNPQYLSFFADPIPFFNTDFAAFTNNPSQVQTTSTGFVITNGGGSANFLNVPEPGSMGLLGVGLAGFLLVGMRRNTV